MPHQSGATDSQVADVLTFKSEFADEFGKFVTTPATVTLDLPSTYDATAERYKLFENGARTDLSASSMLTETEVSYELAVAAGNTVRWQTRERPRYMPNHDAVWSTAFRLASALQSGDTLRVGQGSENLDPASNTGTGWYFEFAGGADPAFVIFNAGEAARQTYTDFPVSDFSNPVRLSDVYNLYNVGPHQPTVYYTDASANPDAPGTHEHLQPVSVDDDWAVGEFNVPIFYEFSVGSLNSTKTLEVGSINHSVLGPVTETVRNKWARDRNISAAASVSVNATSYTPFLAIRLAPGSEDVLASFNAFRLNADTAGEVIIKEFYPDQVAFSSGTPNWQTPPQQTPEHTAIQVSEQVTQIEDQSGAMVNQTATPAGFQVGMVADEGSGTGNQVAEGNLVNVKRPLYPDGIAVAMKRNDPGLSTGAGGSFAFETSQTF